MHKGFGAHTFHNRAAGGAVTQVGRLRLRAGREGKTRRIRCDGVHLISRVKQTRQQRASQKAARTGDKHPLHRPPPSVSPMRCARRAADRPYSSCICA